jgi:hypothetical protein
MTDTIALITTDILMPQSSNIEFQTLKLQDGLTEQEINDPQTHIRVREIKTDAGLPFYRELEVNGLFIITQEFALDETEPDYQMGIQNVYIRSTDGTPVKEHNGELIDAAKRYIDFYLRFKTELSLETFFNLDNDFEDITFILETVEQE